MRLLLADLPAELAEDVTGGFLGGFIGGLSSPCLRSKLLPADFILDGKSAGNLRREAYWRKIPLPNPSELDPPLSLPAVPSTIVKGASKTPNTHISLTWCWVIDEEHPHLLPEIPAATTSITTVNPNPQQHFLASATLSSASSHLRRILPSTELPAQPQQTCISQRVSSSQRREGAAGSNMKDTAEPPVRSAARLTELLSGTVSLATFNNSALSYANGYDEHTERECEEAGSEGMTFLACVVDS
ncbi:hypothetical protein PIB30_096724, partial [Stylosanthes scabra]|nr:hypothetical protein [Stylosanthes scabra]